jgi:hypothetical protein
MAMQKQYRTRFALLAMTVVVGVMTALFLVGSAAAAEDPYSNDGPKILPSVIERDEPERPDAVIDERETTPPPPDETPPPPQDERGPLPFTGADLTLFLATGMAAVATGSVIVRRTRTRNDQ